jgi:hypothetical protein
MCSRLILSGRSWYDKENSRTASTESTEMNTLPTVWKHSVAVVDSRAEGLERLRSTEVFIRTDVDVSVDAR